MSKKERSRQKYPILKNKEAKKIAQSFIPMHFLLSKEKKNFIQDPLIKKFKKKCFFNKTTLSLKRQLNALKALKKRFGICLQEIQELESLKHPKTKD